MHSHRSPKTTSWIVKLMWNHGNAPHNEMMWGHLIQFSRRNNYPQRSGTRPLLRWLHSLKWTDLAFAFERGPMDPVQFHESRGQCHGVIVGLRLDERITADHLFLDLQAFSG
jgi:hypothetical protein